MGAGAGERFVKAPAGIPAVNGEARRISQRKAEALVSARFDGKEKKYRG